MPRATFLFPPSALEERAKQRTPVKFRFFLMCMILEKVRITPPQVLCFEFRVRTLSWVRCMYVGVRLVVAYHHLQENPDPTSEELRSPLCFHLQGDIPYPTPVPQIMWELVRGNMEECCYLRFFPWSTLCMIRRRQPESARSNKTALPLSREAGLLFVSCRELLVLNAVFNPLMPICLWVTTSQHLLFPAVQDTLRPLLLKQGPTVP